ncbi:MAG: ATP-binding cassette domain-containing protein [Candidatus Izemoplasmatales bacterium]
MIHLKRIQITSPNHRNYPYNLPLFEGESRLCFTSDVVIIVGDNGSGKSSLLKLIQDRLHLYEISDPTPHPLIKLDTSTMTLDYYLSKPKGFFFESQKFINYITYINNELEASKEEIKRVDEEYINASDYAKMMAKSPHQKTIYELKNMYSKDLSKSSHGESYLDFFSSRIKENQLYLLDEPETPLSVQNQLTLLSMIMDARKHNNQFIIATHSPILSAIPGAQIFEIKDQTFVETTYEEISSIKLLKQFINHKEQFLKHFE